METTPMRRGAFYIRESTEEQGHGYAPQAQEYAMREYAEKNRINLHDEQYQYKELISGRYADKRPEFQRMMDDAAAHKFDVILVYHTSRFARNVGEARSYKTELRKKLNIDVISVSQNFGDWNDPNAFFSESMNEVMDEQVSRVISFHVRGGLAMKRRLGNQLGNPPFGYFKKQLGYDEEKNRKIYESKWQIHEQYGPVVLELFTKYATGRYSFADLAKDLNNRGVKTQLGNLFTYSSIKDTLNNKAYCGTTYSPRRNAPEVPAKHPIIISIDLYNEVQTMIQQRNQTKGRPSAQHHFYLLQDVVYCYKCRHHLRGKENGPVTKKLLPRMYCETNNSGPAYCCKMRREIHTCDQKKISCKTIDIQIDKFMQGFSIPTDIVAMTIQKLDNMIQVLPKSLDVQTKIDNLEEKLKRISRTYADGNLNETSYEADTLQVKNDLAALGALAQSPTTQYNAKDFVASAERLLRDFPTMWNNETPETKRQWILLTIKRVWVDDETVVAIEPHDKFKKLFPQLREVLGQAPLATP